MSPGAHYVVGVLKGPASISIVKASSQKHYHVSGGHLRDWSAGNEIMCHSTNAHTAKCSL